MRNNLRRIRRAADITQEQLAREVGCCRQTINNIERERNNASIEMMEKISKALNRSIADIFFNETV